MRVNVPSEGMENPYGYVMSHYARDITQAAVNFSQATFVHSKLSFREYEAGRRKIAEINGCMACLSFRPAKELQNYLEYGANTQSRTVANRGDPPDEPFYEAVAQWRSAPQFSARERMAIEYAERFATDPKGIAVDEEFWTRVKQNYSDEEIVDLNCCIAGWLGFGRLTHALGLDSVCAFAPPQKNRAAA